MARKSTKTTEPTVEQVISEGAPMSFKEARDLISQSVVHHLEAFHPKNSDGSLKKSFSYVWKWEPTQLTKTALLQLDARVFKAIILKALDADIDRYFRYMTKDNPDYAFKMFGLVHDFLNCALEEEKTDTAKKEAELAYLTHLIDEEVEAQEPKSKEVELTDEDKKRIKAAYQLAKAGKFSEESAKAFEEQVKAERLAKLSGK